MERGCYARTYPAVLLLAISLISTAAARIITVDDDAPADFNNIQAAIDDATDGDIVEIKPGTYTGPGNYNIRFNGKPIIVRGTDPEDFEVVAATVIDCNNSGARGFTFDRGEDPNSVLSGMTITNGYSGIGGGAIACLGGSPIITNCILTGNTGRGGAIGADDLTDLIVRNCIITHNTSEYNGGGIYGTGLNSTTIENCIISNNTSTSWGGGIRTASNYPALIKECIITGNRANLGGGISSRGPDVVITACLITGNVATEAGGGIYGRNYAKPIISNSIVSGNNAPLGSEIAVADPRSPIPEYDIAPGLEPSYSNIRGGLDAVFVEEGYPVEWGLGNVDADPCFADPGHWGHIDDPNIHVEANDPNALWVDGDYHLKSHNGRWDRNSKAWIRDEVTSLCIDAADPILDWTAELWPNGQRVNLGMHGGTAEASMSPNDVGNIADFDLDGSVSYTDLPFFMNQWLLDSLFLPANLTRDGLVGSPDFAILAQNWQPPSLPELAENPNPSDGATGVSVWLVLKRNPSDGATSHDVYFGTASPGTFQGNQTELTFYPPHSPLSRGTTYYWRIDEVSTAGTTEGAVWSFTTAP